jgi:hypothetical protein
MSSYQFGVAHEADMPALQSLWAVSTPAVPIPSRPDKVIYRAGKGPHSQHPGPQGGCWGQVGPSHSPSSGEHGIGLRGLRAQPQSALLPRLGVALTSPTNRVTDLEIGCMSA